MSQRADEQTLTIHGSSAAAPGATPGAARRSYLLVIEGTSSFIFPLPPSGEVVIGRADDVQLRIADRTASRRHAKLLIGPSGPTGTSGPPGAVGDGIRIVDLDSHNGTRVGGRRITAARELHHGDIIQICDVTLVLHHESAPAGPRAPVELALFRRRLDEEVERCVRYGRALGLVCLPLGEGADTARAAAAIGDELRLLDVLAWDGAAQLLLLSPELGDEDLGELAARLLETVRPLAKEARAGLALYPRDGGDTDTLLSAARAAALQAQAAGTPGPIVRADQADPLMKIGEHTVVVADPAMQRLFALVERLAQSDLPVLIHGETGTGKEIIATALHTRSRRRDKRLLALNCAALPESLAESEIFGHEKGAFTGAAAQKPGVLEQAAGGTVFLDELGELPPSIQAKLLRVLETQKLVRIGGTREIPLDVRLVAATHKNLDEEIRAGRFRQDLFFRLSAARVVLPPLRDRRREIPLLARLFLTRACEKLGRPPLVLSDAAMSLLLSHPWPGNLRELRNVMDFVAATCAGGTVTSSDLLGPLAGSATSGKAEPMAAAPAPSTDGGPPRFRNLEEELRELERTRMTEALKASGGVHVRAAELLGMPIRTFTYKARQYGLQARNKQAT
ncbi:MAG: sigma 54-interacting transcriptional regulator [Polyangia bacterium]